MKTFSSIARHFGALLVGSFFLLMVSCGKTTQHIGDGLLPEGDIFGVFYTDTLGITCHSETIDSLSSKGMTTVLLGSMMDPVMGRTEANLVTQFHLSASNHVFSSEAVLDSIVLQLAVSDWYGDTTTMQTIHVYELADSLDPNQAYYQFSDVSVYPEDLANGFQFYPRPKTTHHVIGHDTIEQSIIRIPLSNTFGLKLLQADSLHYASPDNFKQFMYGLKICAEPVNQGGAISSIYPTSNSITLLELYYHDEMTPASSNPRYDFYITSDEVYFNQYLHDYAQGTPEFIQQVSDGDTALGQQTLYLQSMGGIRTVLRFPGLSHWMDTIEGAHVLINEAKLIIPAASMIGDSSVLAKPSTLALLNINADGTTALLQDYYEGSNYYGGVYSSSQQAYTFRISEYVQQVVSGKLTSQGLYLSIVGASFNAQRWVIAGPNTADENHLRCEIKYSLVGD